jgi:uncharacterized damage-inducible protein DinB
MRRDELQLFLDYDIWATERLLTAAAELREEQFALPAGPGHAPIRATLVHVLDALWSWRLRSQGQVVPAEFPPELAEEESITVGALRSFLEAEREAMHTALGGVQDSDIDRAMQVPSRTGPRTMLPWQMLVHAVNHGTQHRGEVAEALTLLGHSPGDIDFTIFLRGLSATPPTG